jgi:hypothetical protein
MPVEVLLIARMYKPLLVNFIKLNGSGQEHDFSGETHLEAGGNRKKLTMRPDRV